MRILRICNLCVEGEQYIDYKKELAGTVCESVEETVNEIIKSVKLVG